MQRKRCFIYVRVSTRTQAEEGYSVGEQLERLNKFADAMGWLVAQVFVDPGHSGATIDRPALQEMLTVLNAADIVLVDKLDRLSRSLHDTLYLVKKIFEPNNVAFVSRAESFDTSTSFGRAAIGIMAVFAELEREKIKERTRDGMIGRTKAGYWHGNVPQGYRRENGLLVIDEYSAMQMRELFRLFAEGATIINAYEQVYGTHPTSSEVTTVRRKLHNRAYVGEGQFAGEWYQGLHEPLIDFDTFNTVQQKLYERSHLNEKYKPGVKYTSPLGGLIWCKQCGAKYHFRLACCSGKRIDGSKRNYRYTYYGCYSRTKCDKTLIRDPNCKNTHHKAEKLDNAIYSEILALRADPSYIEKLRRSADPGEKIRTIQQQIDKLTAQIARLMELYTVGSIPIDIISSRLEPLTLEKRKLEAQLAECESARQTLSTEEVIRLADDFAHTLESGNPAAIHNALEMLIDYIEIDGNDIHINWRF